MTQEREKKTNNRGVREPLKNQQQKHSPFFDSKVPIGASYETFP